MNQLAPSYRAHRQTGLTLVELMVAMVIGLAVIAAGLGMYTTSGLAGRNSNAVAQMSEDATLALGIMRNHIAMAGYSRWMRDPTSNNLTKLYNSRPIFGCRFGVTNDTSNNRVNEADVAKPVTCAAQNNPTGGDTLIVIYEADTDNTIATTGSATTPPSPTDCLGNGVRQVTPAAGTSTPVYWVAENRFSVDNTGSLTCLGTSNNAAQPLVDNVAQMRILYGVSSPDGTIRGTVAQRYLSAEQIGAMTSDTWDQVVSVRLCLVIQSRDAVLDTSAPYIDCDGNSQSPTDRRLYRAFTSTVVLHNRISQN